MFTCPYLADIVAWMRQQITVCLFVFDLLFLNGSPLLNKSLFERRQLIQDHINTLPGEIMMAVSRDMSDFNDVSETMLFLAEVSHEGFFTSVCMQLAVFLNQSVDEGQCEGLMVKTLHGNSEYLPGKRSFTWMKVVGSSCGVKEGGAQDRDRICGCVPLWRELWA